MEENPLLFNIVPKLRKIEDGEESPSVGFYGYKETVRQVKVMEAHRGLAKKDRGWSSVQANYANEIASAAI